MMGLFFIEEEERFELSVSFNPRQFSRLFP